MKQKLIEIFGWYGTCAIVLAYILVSFSFTSSTSLIYQALNLTGALGIMAISFYKKTYQPGILNLIWFLVALIAIINIIR
ncbi:MAG: echA1 [Candidatus Parcubacteria bacterium]|nr:echA1 [Candidatus Parcubacteria bacterium]